MHVVVCSSSSPCRAKAVVPCRHCPLHNRACSKSGEASCSHLTLSAPSRLGPFGSSQVRWRGRHRRQALTFDAASHRASSISSVPRWRGYSLGTWRSTRMSPTVDRYRISKGLGFRVVGFDRVTQPLLRIPCSSHETTSSREGSRSSPECPLCGPAISCAPYRWLCWRPR